LGDTTQKQPVKKVRPLTAKQRKFVKAKAEGKTTTAAAQEAYGISYNSARALGSENMTKLSIQEAVNAELSRQGVTLEAIIKPITDGLTATKVIVMGKESADSFVDLTPDHSVRLKASSMAAQFMGIGKQAEATPLSVHFHNHQAQETSEYGL
jgi:phage terminase small subunit